MDAEELLRLKVRLLTEGASIVETEWKGRKGLVSRPFPYSGLPLHRAPSYPEQGRILEGLLGLQDLF